MGTQKLKRVPIAEVPKWGPMWEQWQSDQLLFNDVDQNPKNFVADFSTSQKKRNIVFRNKGGGGSHLEVFRKLIHFCERNRP